MSLRSMRGPAPTMPPVPINVVPTAIDITYRYVGEVGMATNLVTYLVTAAVWTLAGMEGQRILAAAIRRFRPPRPVA